MSGNTTPKHQLYIRETGRIEKTGTVIEVHSLGGSLFGLKGIIDEFSKRQSLNIKTMYDTQKGASHLGVIFADQNCEDAAEKLDTFIARQSEFNINGYFSDALAAAVIGGTPD